MAEEPFMSDFLTGTETVSRAVFPGLAERLERGELIYLPVCPFPLPDESDRVFLDAQQLGNGRHKNVSYSPDTGKVSGFARQSGAQKERLRQILASFSHTATAWLSAVLPRYRQGWRLDRVSFRPLEEATRALRLRARNDLLHIDAFPTRPSGGCRLLRVFVNVNQTDPRIWVTSDAFPSLLERYGKQAGLPSVSHGSTWAGRFLGVFPRLLRPGKPPRTPYDAFMLRFHHFLKACDEFQERSVKRLWTFASGSAWLAMTDGLSHAVLRGRLALDHSYFIPPECQALPEESPAALLARACGGSVVRRAA
jgi:3-deoxy-D-manno-oct-2-ulosonic acid (Kdo) hydroxylase